MLQLTGQIPRAPSTETPISSTAENWHLAYFDWVPLGGLKGHALKELCSFPDTANNWLV